MLQFNQIIIVYPNTAQLDQLAKKLASQMEHFRIPGSVRAHTGIRLLSDVREPWLIVLCTPDTPKDREVLEQIRLFTERGLYQHILTLLVAGNPEESFPEPLLHEHLPDGSVIDHEPLAANIVAASAAETEKKLKIEKLRLLAPVLGVSFDELMNRRRRQRIRIVTAAATVLLAGACAFLGVSIYRVRMFTRQQEELSAQYEKTKEAEDQATKEKENSLRSFATSVGVEAAELLKKGDTELAMLLCAEFLPEYKEVPELSETLKQALIMQCAAGYVPVTAGELPLPESDQTENTRTFQQFKEEAGLDDIDWYSEVGDYTITNRGSEAMLYQTSPLKLLFTFENDHTRLVDDYTFGIVKTASGKNYLIHGDHSHGEYVYDIETGKLENKMEFGYGEYLVGGVSSSEGYVIFKRGNSMLSVVDAVSGQFIASVDPPFYPVTEVAFAGKLSPDAGSRDASAILVNGILFRYREEAQEVPSGIDEQLVLAGELLNGRTLTEEERIYYSLS